MICEVISPYSENYFVLPLPPIPFHTSVSGRKIYEHLIQEDQGCLYVYPHTHTHSSPFPVGLLPILDLRYSSQL